MKTRLKGVLILFTNFWIIASSLSSSDDNLGYDDAQCTLSSQEKEKWKNFTAFHPKLTLLLSNTLTQELKTICNQANFTTSVSPTIVTVPNGFDKEYPAFMAWKTDVEVNFKGRSIIVDYDKIDLDSMGLFDGKQGSFTAPVEGLYYFAFTQVKYRDLKGVNVMIRRNDNHLHSNTLDFSYNVDAWCSLFTQGIIKLEKGDVVRARQDTIDYPGRPVTPQINAMLERTRIFIGFLIPNTTYWTGIKPQSPFTTFPTFFVHTTREFNAYEDGGHFIVYKNSEQSENGIIDPKTGVFNANVRGIYYLSFISNKYYTNSTTGWNVRGFIQLLKNGKEEVAVSYCDSDGAGSRTVMMHFAQITVLLEVGDTIQAFQQYGKTFSYDLPSTSLIGFLIVPVPQVQNVMATNYPVFNAHRSTLVEMNKTKVNFDIVTINQGGHLNGQTGVFVAPFKGYYFFSYCDTTLKSSRYTVARILNNGNPVAVAHAHSGDRATWLVTPLSVKATLQLEAGDNVYVEEWGVGTGDGNSTRERSSLTVVFTGFLLYPTI